MRRSGYLQLKTEMRMRVKGRCQWLGGYEWTFIDGYTAIRIPPKFSLRFPILWRSSIFPKYVVVCRSLRATSCQNKRT